MMRLGRFLLSMDFDAGEYGYIVTYIYVHSYQGPFTCLQWVSLWYIVTPYHFMSSRDFLVTSYSNRLKTMKLWWFKDSVMTVVNYIENFYLSIFFLFVICSFFTYMYVFCCFFFLKLKYILKHVLWIIVKHYLMRKTFIVVGRVGVFN